MASGRLARSMAPTAGGAPLYTPPAGMLTSATLSMVNTSASNVNVSVLISSSSTSSGTVSSDYIESNAVLLPGGVLERTGLVIGAGTYMYVYCATSSVLAVNLWGYEE